MRRSVLLMFVVVFTICVCKASVRAESSPVSLGQPTEIPQEEKTPVINKTNKDGELKHTVAARQPDNTKKRIQLLPVQLKKMRNYNMMMQNRNLH